MLTSAETQTLTEYKTEKYFDINEALRNDDFTDEVEVIDDIMSKSVIDEGVVLYRGTSLYAMDLDEDEDYTGEIITDRAFMSTTAKKHLAARKFYRGLLLIIEAPAGTHAAEPEEILFENEDEVILDRDLELEVIEDNCDEDERVMRVRVI